VISVDDLNGSHAAPPGNLHAVAAELHEMTKATKELNEIIRSASSSLLESQEYAPTGSSGYTKNRPATLSRTIPCQ
jgi:hypothetical protein